MYKAWCGDVCVECRHAMLEVVSLSIISIESWLGLKVAQPVSHLVSVFVSQPGRHLVNILVSVLPRILLQGAAPCPFSWCPALLKKPKWCPALLTNFFFVCVFNISHMALALFCPFFLPTHSVDCAVHLLLSHLRALLVSSALFHPFTALIMPFFFSSPC